MNKLDNLKSGLLDCVPIFIKKVLKLDSDVLEIVLPNKTILQYTLSDGNSFDVGIDSLHKQLYVRFDSMNNSLFEIPLIDIAYTYPIKNNDVGLSCLGSCINNIKEDIEVSSSIKAPSLSYEKLS